MKILIGCLLFREFTGSEMYVFELAKNLQKLGCDVTITSPHIGGPLTDLALSLGIKVHNIKVPFINKNYDIIHSQHYPVTQTLLKLFPKNKMICTIHSEVISLENPIIHENIKKYITIRPEIQNHIIKNFWIPENKTCVIYNPIDTNKFNMNDTTSGNYTLFVGTIDYLRQNTIRDLVDKTKSENKELYLVGKNHANYLNEILSNHHVKHFNQTYDVEKFVKNCGETAGILLGRTTIEGWLCGKPGWIYDIDSNGSIKNKTLHQVPNNLEIFNSEIVAQQIKDEYLKIL
jgi:glycosyltransferase involved in cell wall biosynthesis